MCGGRARESGTGVFVAGFPCVLSAVSGAERMKGRDEAGTLGRKGQGRATTRAAFRVIDCRPLPPIKRTAGGWARLLGLPEDQLRTQIFDDCRRRGPRQPVESVIIDLLRGRRVTAVRLYGYLAKRRPEWAARLVARLPGCPLRLGEWGTLLGVSREDLWGWLSVAWHVDGDPEAWAILSEPTRDITAEAFRACLARRRPQWAARLAELLPAAGPRGEDRTGVSRAAGQYGGQPVTNE